MSKCTEIREFCGDYAFDVEYSEDNVFTMFFNSLRNAQTVKRCIEVDDSAPNVATAVDFVEVVRCKDCKWWTPMDRGYSWHNEGRTDGECQILYSNHYSERALTEREHFCSFGERKEQG